MRRLKLDRLQLQASGGGRGKVQGGGVGGRLKLDRQQLQVVGGGAGVMCVGGQVRGQKGKGPVHRPATATCYSLPACLADTCQAKPYITAFPPACLRVCLSVCQ